MAMKMVPEESTDDRDVQGVDTSAAWVPHAKSRVRAVGRFGFATGLVVIWLALLIATSFSAVVVAAGLPVALGVLNS